MTTEHATAGRRLALTVYVTNPDGSVTTYLQGDVPPPAIARSITNPAAWEPDPEADLADGAA